MVEGQKIVVQGYLRIVGPSAKHVNHGLAHRLGREEPAQGLSQEQRHHQDWYSWHKHTLYVICIMLIDALHPPQHQGLMVY
jgi:hypothetical protein